MHLCVLFCTNILQTKENMHSIMICFYNCITYAILTDIKLQTFSRTERYFIFFCQTILTHKK